MGDSHPRSSGRPSGAASSGGVGWRQYLKSGVEHLEWDFAVLVFVCEAASYVCLWQLDRIALGTGAWFPIATAQLSGNAVGRFVPGAPTPFTVELLHKAGVDTGQAAAAFTTSTGLQLATTAALPLLAWHGHHRSWATTAQACLPSSRPSLCASSSPSRRRCSPCHPIFCGMALDHPEIIQTIRRDPSGSTRPPT